MSVLIALPSGRRASGSSLFVPRRPMAVFPSLRAELDAVARGDKALAMEVWPHHALSSDPDHAAWLRLANARGLHVIHRPDTGPTGIAFVAVYACRPEHVWRIAALHLLWRVVPAEASWSDGAEALESALLGYTPAQRAAWLAHRRHARLGWRGVTIYLLLARGQRRAIAAIGDRAIPEAAFSPGIIAAWCEPSRVIAARLPAWVARERLTLARVALTESAFAALFSRRGAVRIARLNARHARVLNEGLESKLELFGRRGWN